MTVASAQNPPAIASGSTKGPLEASKSEIEFMKTAPTLLMNGLQSNTAPAAAPRQLIYPVPAQTYPASGYVPPLPKQYQEKIRGGMAQTGG